MTKPPLPVPITIFLLFAGMIVFAVVGGTVLDWLWGQTFLGVHLNYWALGGCLTIVLPVGLFILTRGKKP